MNMHMLLKIVLAVILGGAPQALSQGRTFRVEPAGIVLQLGDVGPGNAWQVDGPVFSVRTGNEVRLFVTASPAPYRFSSYVMTGTNLSALWIYQTPVLGAGCSALDGCLGGPDTGGAGAERVYDKCGAWLLGAITSGTGTGPIEALYHAEELCNYSDVVNFRPTLKSIASAVSQNNGFKFRRVGQVITAAQQPPSDGTVNGTPVFQHSRGQGDHSVIRWQGSPWIYFSGSDLQPTGVARRDADGVWKKWDGSSFSQPGLGGASAPVLTASNGVYGRQASKTSTELFLTGFDSNPPSDDDESAVYFWTSANGLNFTRAALPIIRVSDPEISGPREERLIYPSLLPPNGDSYFDSWSSSVWLFYGLEDREHNLSTSTTPSSNDGQRKLIRRLVNVTSNGTGADIFLVALTRYYSPTIDDHWATTQVTWSGYHSDWALGYVLTNAASGTRALYECFNSVWDDHFLSIDPQCEGNARLRRSGWIYTSAGAGRSSLRRCVDSVGGNHIAVKGGGCGAYADQGILGYVVD